MKEIFAEFSLFLDRLGFVPILASNLGLEFLYASVLQEINC